MRRRVDAGFIQPPRPADGQDDVFRAIGRQRAIRPDDDHAARAFGIARAHGEQLHDTLTLAHRNAQFLHAANQGAAHFARGVRADRRGPLARVVVGLVTHKLPVTVAGKRQTQVDQVHERSRREAGFDQRQIAVHTAAVKIGFGHRQRRIGLSAAHGQFVIGLLVAAGIDRRALVQPFGDNQNIIDAVGAQLQRRVQPRRAAADDQRVNPGNVVHSVTTSPASARHRP